MNSDPPVLPGHALKVRVIGVFSGIILIGGAIVAGVGQQIGPAGIVPYGTWGVLAGFVGLVVAGALVRHAKCPSCGSIMKQGEGVGGAKLDGEFACAKCGKKWRTTERSRMNIGID